MARFAAVQLSPLSLLLLLIIGAHAFPHKDVLFAEISEPEVRDIKPVIDDKTVVENIEVAPESNTKGNDTNIVAKTIFSGSDLQNSSDVNNVEDRVSYAGAQLWKVVLDSNRKKIVIASLRDNKGKYISIFF